MESYFKRLWTRLRAPLPSSHRKAKLKRQAKRSTFVGVTATAIDVTFLNLIVGIVGMHPVVANIISMTLSTTYSYSLNRKIVFTEGERSKRKTIVPFVLVTLVGVYGVQSVVMALVIHYGESIGTFAAQAGRGLVGAGVPPDVWLLNIAKLLAGSVAGIWNFVLYRHAVFKDHR